MPSSAGISSPAMRVGILGAGAMGKKHLKAWRGLGVQVAGIYARNLERGRVAAAPYGCAVYDSVDALLRNVEIADICLPTFLHKTAVQQAAQAGCQIICEKPLALRYEDGEAIFNQCDAANVRIFLAMVLRFFPVYRAAWQQVSKGALGEVEQIALKRIVPPPPAKDSWFFDDQLSGGMLSDLLIHDVDYAMWLAGDVTRVEAMRAGNGPSQYAHIRLEHSCGAISKVEGGWVESAAGLETAIDITGSQERLQILPGGPVPLTDLSQEDPYVAQLRHFQDSLARQEPFLVTREEVLRVMRVMSAARESAEHGHPISLEPRPAR